MDKKPLRRELDFVGALEDVLRIPPNNRQTVWVDEYQVYDVSDRFMEEQFEKELKAALDSLGVTREQLNAGQYHALAECRAALETYLSISPKADKKVPLSSALVQEDSLLR